MKHRVIILIVLIATAAAILLFSLLSKKEHPQVFVPLQTKDGGGSGEVITARDDWGYPRIYRTWFSIYERDNLLEKSDIDEQQRMFLMRMQIASYQLLSAKGWSVRSVESGEKVLSAFYERFFDLVLMDLSLHSADGIEITRKLRLFEHERGRSRTPIIALTGHVGDGTKEKCFDAGMDGFLSKPFQEEELLREIERVLK